MLIFKSQSFYLWLHRVYISNNRLEMNIFNGNLIQIFFIIYISSVIYLGKHFQWKFNLWNLFWGRTFTTQYNSFILHETLCYMSINMLWIHNNPDRRPSMPWRSVSPSCGEDRRLIRATTTTLIFGLERGSSLVQARASVAIYIYVCRHTTIDGKFSFVLVQSY